MLFFNRINLFEYINYDRFLFLIVSISVSSSFLLQFMYNLTPCKLCLYQRYLWVSLLLFCILNLFKSFKSTMLIKYIILAITLVTFLLSFYHSGIELNIFNNIIACSETSGINPMTIEELDTLIRASKNTDCSFPKFFFFGLTLSNFSFIFSLMLFILSLKFFEIHLFNKYEKKN